MTRILSAAQALCLLLLLPVGAFAAFDSADFNKAKSDLEILNITPTGEDVPAARQIVINFNQPVVPVGRMDRKSSEIPVTITPALKCEWRWLNTSSLACQLDEHNALQPSTRYTVVIRPGIKTEQGTGMKKEVTHSFITQRPRVVRVGFDEWIGPGSPKIILKFDQPVLEFSLHQSLTLRRNGTTFPFTVTPDPNVQNAVREIERRQKTGTQREQRGDVFGVIREGIRTLFFEGRNADADPEIMATNVNKSWIITPKEPLPLESKIFLDIAPGIVPDQGNENGIEQRSLVNFHTYPEFRVKSLECRDLDGDRVSIRNGGAINSNRCDPERGYTLVFSTPPGKESVGKDIKISPSLVREDGTDPMRKLYTWHNRRSPHYPNSQYGVQLPREIKAFSRYTLSARATDIRDVFDRPLQSDLNITFQTDHFSPSFSILHPMSVLEKYIDSHLPTISRNVDSVDLSYEVKTTDGTDSSLKHILKPAKPVDVGFVYPIETRNLLGGRSGVIQGSWSSSPGSPSQSYYGLHNWFMSQVTPFHVHVKTGHYNSMVWVTDLATGKPVADARVRIYTGRLNSFDNSGPDHGEARTNRSGVATLPGLKTIDPQLQLINSGYRGSNMLFVEVSRGKDMALVPLLQDFHMRTWGNNNNVNARLRQIWGHMRAWGFTAQGVHKAGDTIDYKIYVRDQSNRQFVAPPRSGYLLQIIDPMGKKVYEGKDLQLSEFGALSGSYTVPKTGAVGWYTFNLRYPKGHGRWQPLRVLVADFTPSPFRVGSEIHGKLFSPGDEVSITSTASLHAGGPFANAQTRVTAQIVQAQIRPQDASVRSFGFDVFASGSQTVHQSEARVDAQGKLTTVFKMPESNVLYGRLRVESAIRDDRGKYIAAGSSATFAGRDHYAGIRLKDWVFTAGKSAAIETLVIDRHGKIKSGAPLEVKVEYRETVASRVKGAGNAYLTNYSHKWVDAHSCSMKSTAKPGVCSFSPKKAGLYRISVTTRDSKGRVHTVIRNRWASGKDFVLWDTRSGYQLNIFPEKDEYKIGETARYMIQNPFPGAEALVTIERFGVMDQFIKPLKNSIEILEIPVTRDSLPGFYVSVTVMSPRQGEPKIEGEVDLAKPTFRMGYARTEVRDPARELRFTIKTDKASYKPGATAKIRLQASDQKGKHPEMEYAVAVLDEAVFDLIQNKQRYFDPYKGFYTLDPLDMRNFNLLTHMVGMRKFEKKGANPGGGGGPGGPDIDARTLFKYLAYWNPSIRPDGDGKASIEVKLPDNLTGWRVLAVAMTRDDLMGLGQETFTVNKLTELRPALPNQVTEGDEFTARFTLMNRSDKARTLKVHILAEGAVADGKALNRTLEIQAPPYQRQILALPTRAGKTGTITYTVKAWDDADSDGVILKLPVRRLQSLETAATYGTTTREKITERVKVPEKIRTDVGNFSIVASPTVIGNVQGAFDYIKFYPYFCWEQRLTKGTMASHFLNLRPYIPREFSWVGAPPLPQATLDVAADFQAPNGGMTYYVPRNKYVSPYLSAYTAIAFNWLRDAKHQVPEQVETKLHGYLQNMLRKEVFPDFYSKGMATTVRAVALAALAERGALSRGDVLRYERHVPQMDLFGKAHYLKALVHTPGTEAQQKKLAGLIRAHANETGGKFTFSETLEFAYSRIHTSELRTNCAVLSAWLDYETRGAGKNQQSDLPFKLVNTITQGRGQRDRWENTQENMFCMNALIQFSREYEETKPDMHLKFFKQKQEIGKTSFDDFRDAPVTIVKDLEKSDPGKKFNMEIHKRGQGRYYYSTRLTWSPIVLRKEPVNAGMTIHREYHVERDGKWLRMDDDTELRMGELVRVDLFINLPAARNFVVVSDPIPGGLEPVNADLATASTVDAKKGAFTFSGGSFWYRFKDWRAYGYSFWSFYHKELRHDRADFYSEYLPSGNYHLSYTAQAIAPGEFAIMPAHVEEMYNPDTFGKGVPGRLRVIDKP